MIKAMDESQPGQGGVEQCLETLEESAQGPLAILHSSLQRGRSVLLSEVVSDN